MTDMNTLLSQIQSHFPEGIETATLALGELTLEIQPEKLVGICKKLRDEPVFDFKLLIDVCGVDYLQYGQDDWQTSSATTSGFSRGVMSVPEQENPGKPNRFAVVYHLLSLSNNQRLRLRVNIPDHQELIVDSVLDIWPAANWYEREAFDLFGILFRGHPDLRRLLTDYGFVGHPFRKDFPLIGKVEARYDATLKCVVYEPVSIEARVLEPKVIRRDSRYLCEPGETAHGK